MTKKLSLVLFLLGSFFFGSNTANAQAYTFGGYVFDKASGEPVEFATVVLEGTSQWAIADAKGYFEIKNVSAGKNLVEISSLGYVSDVKEIVISKDITNYKIYLKQDNLALEGAVVTAQENANSATTSRTIDRTALDHVQVLNVSNITSLLPGGATVNPSLTSDQNFTIRGNSSEDGNASFGTAVEVDGVRLSSNANFANSVSSGLKSAPTNNIASSNIESVEVITGVPSVEYGDMTSGVVKINTRKGKTPWTATMSTTPNNKQFSLSKGFGLGSNRNGGSRGVLNASAEYTRSISSLMSPYTSYTREQLSLNYSNLYSKGVFADTPLRFSAGLTGNLGGLDNSADPDLLKDTYIRTKDNALRANANLNWLLNKPWITNLELNASLSYSDRFKESKEFYSSAVSSVVLHGRERGYNVAQDYAAGAENSVMRIAPGQWYNIMFLDDKPLTYKVTLKANQARNFGKVNNKVKLGVDLTGDKNLGIGEYTEELATAPSFREYRFNDIPWMTNVSAYLEDNLMVPVGKDGRINLIAGVRNDNTIIKGSAYGVTSSVSPRFNVKYTVFSEKGRRDKFVKELSFRGSWGVAVKQPSFSILYPQPTYYDIEVFTSTVDKNNNMSRAFFIMPRTVEYNSNLRWQKSNQSEVGMDIKLGGTKISLAAFYNTSMDSYVINSRYEPFSYNYTSVSDVQGMSIPADRRVFSIDPATGIVTVSDANKAIASQQAPYTTKKQLINATYADNSKGIIRRYGLEWVLDFPKIEAINTSVRVDGKYYSYYSLNSDIIAYSPYTQISSDGSQYKYVGYFYGTDSQTNGRETRSVTNNITLTTHIPQVRMILSLKLESTLLSYSRALSGRTDGTARSYVLKDRTDYLSYSETESIYDGDCYTVTFPDYYSSIDNLGELRDFLTDFKAAAASGDKKKYDDLSKLVTVTAYNYIMKKDYISPYFCMNISVTKEIGDMVSLSFYANNFINNRSLVHSTKTGNYMSVSGYIPAFYYGLTARLKF